MFRYQGLDLLNDWRLVRPAGRGHLSYLEKNTFPPPYPHPSQQRYDRYLVPDTGRRREPLYTKKGVVFCEDTM